MGRLTPEKKESIRKTYDQNHSYTETGNVEKVDPRTVKNIVSSEHDQIVSSLKNPSDQIKISPKSFDFTPPIKPYGEIEAEAFVLFREGKDPPDVLIILNSKKNPVTANVVNKMYCDYLISNGMEAVGEIIKQNKDRISTLVALDKRIDSEQLDLDGAMENLKLLPQIRSAKRELEVLKTQVKESKDRKEESLKQEQIAKGQLDVKTTELGKLEKALQEGKTNLDDITFQAEYGKKLVSRIGNEDLPKVIKKRNRESLKDMTILRVLIRDVINVVVKHPYSRLLLKTDEASVDKLSSKEMEELKNAVAAVVEEIYDNLFAGQLMDIFQRENEKAKAEYLARKNSGNNNLPSPQRYYKQNRQANI